MSVHSNPAPSPPPAAGDYCERILLAHRNAHEMAAKLVMDDDPASGHSLMAYIAIQRMAHIIGVERTVSHISGLLGTLNPEGHRFEVRNEQR